MSGGRSRNERWQEQMSPFFASLRGQRPDEAFGRLPEIFHWTEAMARTQISRVTHPGDDLRCLT